MDNIGGEIEIIFKNGNRETYTPQSISFYGLLSLFHPILQGEKPDPNVETAGMSYILSIVYRLGVAEVKFARFRNFKFIEKGIDGGTGYEIVCTDLGSSFDEESPKLSTSIEIPSPEEMLLALKSGRAKIGVIDGHNLPPEIRDGLREIFGSTVGDCQCSDCVAEREAEANVKHQTH